MNGIILALAGFLTSFFSVHDTSIALNGAGSFRVGGAYPTTIGSTLGPAFGSWSGSDAGTGKLVSAVFSAPLLLEFKIAGYPRHAGISIFLQDTENGATYAIEPLSNSGEAWLTADFLLPVSWHQKKVRLIAIDNSRSFEGWLGISDLKAISLAHSVLTLDRLQAVIALPCIFFVWLLPGISVFVLIDAKKTAKCILAFPIAILSASFLSLIIFFLALASPVCAQFVGRTIFVVSFFVVAFPQRKRLLQALSSPDVTVPFSIGLTASMAYTALLIFAVPGDHLALAAQHAFGFTLPDDNILPGILSDRVFAHAPPRPFLRDWLSSDRPPLQTGIDLYVRSIAYNGPFYSLRYQLVGTICQTVSLGIIYTLARSAGATVASSLLVVFGSAFSGFFLVNSTFVWPKLLAGGLAGASIVLFLNVGSEFKRCIACGLALGLAMMAHGGVAFTLPVLMVFALAGQKRRFLAPYFAGLLALGVVMFPWQMYQHFIDPPGDRLLKWHLAGDTEVDSKSFTSVLVHAYSSTSFKNIVLNKLSNFTILFAPEWSQPRYKQFFGTFPTLGALILGIIGITLKGARSYRLLMDLRNGGPYVLISIASLILWCLTMFGPDAAVVHQGSYLTVMLLMTGLMLGAQAIPSLTAIIICAQTVLFIAIYFPSGLSLHPVTLDTISGILVAGAGLCIIVLQLQQSTRFRKSPKILRNTASRILARNAEKL